MATPVEKSASAAALPKSVKYDLPLGEMVISDGTLRRVFRPGSETCNCFYIAIDRLRAFEYVSHDGSKAISNLEKVDTAFKRMREQIASHEKSIPLVDFILHNSEWRFKAQSTTKENATIPLDNSKAALAALQKELKTASSKEEMKLLEKKIYSFQQFIDGLEGFLAQDTHETFMDYLMDLKLKKRGLIMVDALLSMNLKLEKMAEKIIEVCKEPDKSKMLSSRDFRDLNSSIWVHHLQRYCENLYCNLFLLKLLPSDGVSMKDFDSFMRLLSIHGPVVLAGYIGRRIYVDAPKKLEEKIGLRDVYGWPVGSKKAEIYDAIFHMVTVIGACPKKEGEGGYVYFLDPQDPSDPKDPTTEKVYKVSFMGLRERLFCCFRAEGDASFFKREA